MELPKKTTPDFSVRYDQAEITYISQFLVSAGTEEVLLDLSSGLINEAQRTGSNVEAKPTLPIQARVALSWSATERLANILNKLIATRKQTDQVAGNIPQPATQGNSGAAVVPQATLPLMSSSTTR